MTHDENMEGERPFNPPALDLQLARELTALMTLLCDDEMQPLESQRLNQILNEFPEARRFYLRYLAMHSALDVSGGCPPGYSIVDAEIAIESLALAQFSGQVDLLTQRPEDSPRQSHAASSVRTSWRWGVSLAASVLLVVSAAYWVTCNRRTIAVRQVSVTGQSQAIATSKVHDDDEALHLVAEVTFVSKSPIWRNPNSSYVVTSQVRAGQSLALEYGQVELTYLSGAKLLLTGPSEFLVRPTGGKLSRGELVAQVPKAGHGFTIETPHGTVVDLGTEFGVVVDDFGVSQVSVFEGKVETMPALSTGKSHDKIQLTSGRALQWSGNSIKPIQVQGQPYRLAAAQLVTSQAEAVSNASLEADFRDNSWETQLWRTIGAVAPSKAGLRLEASANDAQRPYLISKQEFSPSQGAISVVCDLRFENVAATNQASFAILTRSADELSKPGKLWQDILARSVRCRFNTDAKSGEGKLEAGTKYEADREPTNISWGGFSRPLPDTLYRLEMRDDGLNVSLTVSLIDNPSVRKTITCRSLFRGNENFVALEGSTAGATIVERLVISQDRSAVDRGIVASGAQGTKSRKATLANDNAATHLKELVPENAELLVADDFDESELNPELWASLGEVAIQAGQAQLGLPNDNQHIDTWKARPYLLTKRRFDSAKLNLLILGKVTFAENFLNGYGGSFAVMTRAQGAHGGGPGWENSILRRGLRANFWPAAVGFDHSLEIHEKPQPNTISLLAAEGFPISPHSRTYLFQIVDDGQSARLTFIDANDPTIKKTVSHATSSAMTTSGQIGFEGCWGSPVWLDDIRIYRTTGAR